MTDVTSETKNRISVVDPGFPGRGALTPEAVTFRKFCTSKRKNLDPWRGRAPGTPPRSTTVFNNHFSFFLFFLGYLNQCCTAGNSIVVIFS